MLQILFIARAALIRH